MKHLKANRISDADEVIQGGRRKAQPAVEIKLLPVG
jgi:hypothetical protein